MRHLRLPVAGLAHPIALVVAVLSARVLGPWALLAPLLIAPCVSVAVGRDRAWSAHALGLAFAFFTPTALGIAHDLLRAARHPAVECAIPASVVCAAVTPLAWPPYAIATSAILAILWDTRRCARIDGLARLRGLVRARRAFGAGPYRVAARPSVPTDLAEPQDRSLRDQRSQ